MSKVKTSQSLLYSADTRQKLFNYFSANHNIMLLEGDYNEIESILGSKPIAIDEEIISLKLSDIKLDNDNIDYCKALGCLAGQVRSDIISAFIELMRDNYQPQGEGEWISISAIKNQLEVKENKQLFSWEEIEKVLTRQNLKSLE